MKSGWYPPLEGSNIGPCHTLFSTKKYNKILYTLYNNEKSFLNLPNERVYYIFRKDICKYCKWKLNVHIKFHIRTYLTKITFSRELILLEHYVTLYSSSVIFSSSLIYSNLILSLNT